MLNSYAQESCAQRNRSFLIPRLLDKLKKMVDFCSNWLTMIPIKEMNFNLNKREFRDAIKLIYDWEIADLPAMCTCGDLFTVDHAMVYRHGGADHSEAQ